MKIIINKEEVIRGLQKASNLTGQKTGTAFLKSIWLRAYKNQLTIMATDSKIEFSGTYSVTCKEDGIVGVNGKNFYELIKKLPPGEISLRYDEKSKSLILEQGYRKYRILTYDNSWFKELKKFPEDNFISWQGDSFKDLIDRMLYFIPDDVSDENRYLKLEKYDENNKIVVYALKLHTFALKIIEHEGLYNLIDNNGFLIDRSFLVEIKKWLDNDDIYISIDSNRMFIKNKQNETISFPLVYKEFTNYKTFLDVYNSKENKSKLIINKQELKESLDRLYIFVSDIDQIAYFMLNENELIIYVESYDKGEATESIMAKYNGNLEKITFLIKRIRDIIDHFYSENITIEFTHSEGPCRITGNEDIDKDYLVITMPIKVSDEIYYEDEYEEKE